MADPRLEIKIGLAGHQQAAAALRQLFGGFRQHLESVSAYNAALRNGSAVLTRWAAAAAALVGARGFGQAIQQATQNAVALVQLRQALVSTGQAAAGLERSLTSQASALERLTGIEGAAVLGVQRLLFSFGATARQVQELTPLVLDMAAALGTGPEQAARLLGQALDGQAVGLARYNITARDLAGITAQVRQAFGGQAAALHQAKGPLGEAAVLSRQLKENLGELVLVPVNRFLDSVNQRLERLLRTMQEFRARHPTATTAAGRAAESAGDLLSGVGPWALGALLAGKSIGWLTSALKPVRMARLALVAPLQGASRTWGLFSAVTARFTALFSRSLSWVTRIGAAGSLLGGLLAVGGTALAGWKTGRAIRGWMGWDRGDGATPAQQAESARVDAVQRGMMLERYGTTDLAEIAAIRAARQAGRNTPSPWTESESAAALREKNIERAQALLFDQLSATEKIARLNERLAQYTAAMRAAPDALRYQELAAKYLDDLTALRALKTDRRSGGAPEWRVPADDLARAGLYRSRGEAALMATSVEWQKRSAEYLREIRALIDRLNGTMTDALAF